MDHRPSRPERRRAATQWALVAVAIAAFVVAGLAVLGDPADVTLYPIKAGRPSIAVYVVGDSFHSGLTAPTAALLANPGPTAAAVRRLAPQAWTSLGWGDAKFYQHQGWGAARMLDLVRSMLAPGNASTAHVAGVDDPAADIRHPDILRLRLTPAGFRALQRRLDASFALTAGQPVLEVRGTGANDLFFVGRGHASLLAECNQWTGELLHAAGVPTSRLMDTTAPSLFFDLRVRAHAEPVARHPAPSPSPPGSNL